MSNTTVVHVIYGPGWFIEFGSHEEAMRLLDHLTDEGVEAAYKSSLQARYALVVEYYPGSDIIRRHKWAYGEWQEGAPAAGTTKDLRRVDVKGNGTEARRTGQAKDTEYYVRIPKQMRLRLPAKPGSTGPAAPAPPPQPATVEADPSTWDTNPFTGKPTLARAPMGGERSGQAVWHEVEKEAVR